MNRTELAQTLTAAPWSMIPAQAVDLCAWLIGLPDGRIDSLNRLTDAEVYFIGEHVRSTDPDALKDKWLTARHAQALNTKSVTEEGEEWLR